MGTALGCDCCLGLGCRIPGLTLNFKASSLRFYVTFSFCESTNVGSCPPLTHCPFCDNLKSGPFPPRPSRGGTLHSHLLTAAPPPLLPPPHTHRKRPPWSPRMAPGVQLHPSNSRSLVLQGLSLLPKGLHPPGLRPASGSPLEPPHLIPTSKAQQVLLVAPPAPSPTPTSVLHSLCLHGPRAAPLLARITLPAPPASPCPHPTFSDLKGAECGEGTSAWPFRFPLLNRGFHHTWG